MAKLLLALALALVAAQSAVAQTWTNRPQVTSPTGIQLTPRAFSAGFSYYANGNSYLVIVQGQDANSNPLPDVLVSTAGGPSPVGQQATGTFGLGGTADLDGTQWSVLPRPPFIRYGHCAFATITGANTNSATNTLTPYNYIFHVLGGYDSQAGGPVGDIWQTTNPTASNSGGWTNAYTATTAAPTAYPARQFFGASVYNNGRTILLFGGQDQTLLPLQDTWLSRDGGASFQQLTYSGSVNSPWPARWGMAYATTFVDPSRQLNPTVFLIGGQYGTIPQSSGVQPILGDAWYTNNDGTTWTQLAQTVGSSFTGLTRTFAAAAYLPSSNRLLVFGGRVVTGSGFQSQANANGQVFTAGTTTFDPTTNQITFTEEVQTQAQQSSGLFFQQVYGHTPIVTAVPGPPGTNYVVNTSPQSTASAQYVYSVAGIDQTYTNRVQRYDPNVQPQSTSTSYAYQLSAASNYIQNICYVNNQFAATCAAPGTSTTGVRRPQFDCVRTTQTGSQTPVVTIVATTPTSAGVELSPNQDLCQTNTLTTTRLQATPAVLPTCQLPLCATLVATSIASTACSVSQFPNACSATAAPSTTATGAFTRQYYCQLASAPAGTYETDPNNPSQPLIAYPFVVSGSSSTLGSTQYGFNPASSCRFNAIPPVGAETLDIAGATCTVPACTVQSGTYGWFPAPDNLQDFSLNNCQYNFAGVQVCSSANSGTGGYIGILFQCRLNVAPFTIDPTGAQCGPQPSQGSVRPSSGQTYQCPQLRTCVNYYWASVGYGQCQRVAPVQQSTSTSVISSNYCYTSTSAVTTVANGAATALAAASPAAIQPAIYQCYLGGVAVADSGCINIGGLPKPQLNPVAGTPLAASVPCTLLPCIAGAVYLPIGVGQCVSTQNSATCCQRDATVASPYKPGQPVTNQPQCSALSPRTSSNPNGNLDNGVGVNYQQAPTLFQCTYNGEGYPGQCIAPYPNPSTPGSLTDLNGNAIQYYQACTLPYCGIQGDPEFVGFRGQRYEIHGIPGSIFNIITSPRVQYNAEFVFLGAKSDRACNATRTHPWTHPGTYLGTLGFQIGAEKVQILPGDCESGISQLTVNGKELEVGEVHHFAGAGKQMLSYTDAFTVHMALAELDITLENSDNFFNQEVSLTKLGQRTKAMHGLLGQTWSTKTYRDEQGHKHFIEGHPNDYLVQDDDIFGTDFMFNLFKQ